MVYVISSQKNHGKTTTLKQIHTTVPYAYGFYAEKRIKKNCTVAYVLTDFRTGEECILGRLASHSFPPERGVRFAHGRFIFNERGFQWARDNFAQAQEAGATAYFIDELGKIELKGGGHYSLVHSVLQSGMNLYVTIRDVYVKSATVVFNFGDYNVIVPPKYNPSVLEPQENP